MAIKKAGKAVIMSVKRESGNILDSVKQNSALKSALRSVKEGGKSVKHKISASDIKSKFHVPSTSKTSATDLSQMDMAKQYSRYPISNHHHREMKPSKSLRPLDYSSATESRDDNLVHLSAFSASASTMADLNGGAAHDKVEVKPRLSRSEENLIDLDGPTGLGFTLENPLYDLVSNNSVFEESTKSDADLLLEYGLSDYFNQMNFSGGTTTTANEQAGVDNRSGSGAFASSNSNSNRQVNTSSTSGAATQSWATFE